jgi:hypothetical protein
MQSDDALGLAVAIGVLAATGILVFLVLHSRRRAHSLARLDAAAQAKVTGFWYIVRLDKLFVAETVAELERYRRDGRLTPEDYILSPVDGSWSKNGAPSVSMRDSWKQLALVATALVLIAGAFRRFLTLKVSRTVSNLDVGRHFRAEYSDSFVTRSRQMLLAS